MLAADEHASQALRHDVHAVAGGPKMILGRDPSFLAPAPSLVVAEERKLGSHRLSGGTADGLPGNELAGGRMAGKRDTNRLGFPRGRMEAVKVT